jgi:hypothetical protein
MVAMKVLAVLIVVALIMARITTMEITAVDMLMAQTISVFNAIRVLGRQQIVIQPVNSALLVHVSGDARMKVGTG